MEQVALETNRKIAVTLLDSGKLVKTFTEPRNQINGNLQKSERRTDPQVANQVF